jgi:hypothetical protein
MNAGDINNVEAADDASLAAFMNLTSLFPRIFFFCTSLTPFKA